MCRGEVPRVWTLLSCPMASTGNIKIMVRNLDWSVGVRWPLIVLHGDFFVF